MISFRFDSMKSTGTSRGRQLKLTQRTRLTESKKEYLLEVFQTGEQTGYKGDPANVSKLMRKVRNGDGHF